VHAAAAARGEAVELVYATGFIEAEQPVSLSARLTAPVVAITAQEGDHVRKGQPLVVLDASEQKELLAQAQAERRGAELAQNRIETLYRQGWVTRAARDQAAATADAARAGAQAAEARLTNNVVRAPFDGIVLKRDVEPGDLAMPGTVLMQLGDPRRLRVTATVDERDIVGVRPGQDVLLSSESLPGRVLHGRVRAITPGGDPTQRAFRVRLRLNDAMALPFGLTLEANIVTRKHGSALLVPASAYGQGSVWIVDTGDRARRRPVRTGIMGGDKVEIVSGLHDGELVIMSPSTHLTDGVKVRVLR
jgi:RND family efflux transporter MFP subunit